MRRVRYVVLRHDGVERPHFDLMIEEHPGGDLLTWRLSAWPIVVDSTIDRIASHRRAYLDYEGDVSGGRGTVKRVASGRVTLEVQAEKFVVRFGSTVHVLP